jgi:hypothetical protein
MMVNAIAEQTKDWEWRRRKRSLMDKSCIIQSQSLSRKIVAYGRPLKNNAMKPSIFVRCLIVILLVLVQGSYGFQGRQERSLRGGRYSSRGYSRYSNNSSNDSSNNYPHYGQRRPSVASKVFRGLMFGVLGLALLALFFPAVIAGGCGALCCGLGAGAAVGAVATSSNGGDSRYRTQQQQQQHPFSRNNGDGQSQPGDYYNAAHSTAPPHRQSPARQESEFEDCARRAKQEVESSSSSTIQKNPLMQEPYSGQYSTSFVDRRTGVQHNATLNLSFTPDFHGRGFKISGEGDDADGKTVIEDGHVNYDGTAWWRERTIAGDVGLKVLSRGTFDFAQRTFNGTWLANTMEHGSYITFQATSLQVTNPQPSAPSADNQIPLVSASHVLASSSGGTVPVVSSTAVPSAYAPPSAGPPTVYALPF